MSRAWPLPAGGRPARAAGELNIFNWGNYTSPEMIKKFEEAYNVKVTITDYDFNDTALAKVKAGGHRLRHRGALGQLRARSGSARGSSWRPPGPDGELQERRRRWVDVPFDPGRQYSVPWQWGTTGVAVNTEALQGRRRTPGPSSSIRRAELKGKVNVVPEMNDVINSAIKYVGGEPCTERQGDR